MMHPAAAWQLTIHEFFLALAGYRKANSTVTDPMTRDEFSSLIEGNETRPSLRKKSKAAKTAILSAAKSKKRKKKAKDKRNGRRR